MLCTALVLAVHALLILGLPRWGSTGRPGLATGTLITRIVGPQTPEPAQETAQPSATPAPPVPPPTKKEAPPEPAAPPKPSKPEPAPERPAVTRKPRPAVAPEEPRSETRDTSSAPKPPAAGGATGTPGNGSDQELSILAAPPPPQFAPFPPAMPIAARPTDAENREIRASIKSAGDAPALVPHPAEVTYKSVGTVGGIAVDMPSRLTWRHDGTYYETKWIVYHVKAGEQSLYSDGLITPQGLVPLNAMYRTKGDQKLSFDHAGERLLAAPKTQRTSNPPGPQASEAPEAKAQEFKMPPGTQDRLSLLMQLAALLAGEPGRYPPGTAISVPVAIPNPPSVLEWSFVVGEEESLAALNGKELKTIRLTHESTGNTDTKMELWLAPALEYLPARIRVTEANGDTVDFTVQQAFGTEVTRSIPDSP